MTQRDSERLAGKMREQGARHLGWRGKRVLVTGGTGFIGSHLVERLVAEGAKVRVSSIEGIGHLAHIQDSVELIERDITEELNDLVEGIECVFHLAAVTDLAACRDNPLMALRVNTFGTLNLLESATRAGVKKVAYVSTLGVYGVPDRFPQSESHPVAPVEPYAASKLSAEYFVLTYPKTYGLSTSVARCFNTYGPRQRNTMVVPGIITQALQDGCVQVGNLDSTRDFIYVGDVVDGLLQTMETGKDDVFNLGTGRETSIRALITMIGRILDVDIDVRVVEERKRDSRIDVPRSCADVRKAKEHLGWVAKTSLEAGLAKTINYYRSTLGT